MLAAHLTREELEAGLDLVRSAPRDAGTVELVVRRPAEGEREVLEEGRLDLDEGLVGDSWRRRRTRSTPDGSPNPDMQLNVMSARVVDLVAGGDRDRWALAGDQLYLDFDLSEEHLPAGTRLAVGTAVIEVTPPPHTGCAKFMQRFGVDAHKFVNAKEHRPLRLRGLCAKVVEPGPVRPGDAVRKL
jgi:hypothetical protein